LVRFRVLDNNMSREAVVYGWQGSSVSVLIWIITWISTGYTANKPAMLFLVLPFHQTDPDKT
jgi:hypothetical protein